MEPTERRYPVVNLGRLPYWEKEPEDPPPTPGAGPFPVPTFQGGGAGLPKPVQVPSGYQPYGPGGGPGYPKPVQVPSGHYEYRAPIPPPPPSGTPTVTQWGPGAQMTREEATAAAYMPSAYGGRGGGGFQIPFGGEGVATPGAFGGGFTTMGGRYPVVRLGQFGPYSWNVFVQPIGGGPSWTPTAPAGGSDIHCYHCSNPETYSYLSEDQAAQWNKQYDRHCIKVPEQNCKGGAPMGFGGFGGFGGLMTPSGLVPTGYGLTGRLPTRPLGLPA